MHPYMLQQQQQLVSCCRLQQNR